MKKTLSILALSVISASSFATEQTVVFNFNPSSQPHNQTLAEFNAEGGKILISASLSNQQSDEIVHLNRAESTWYGPTNSSGIAIASPTRYSNTDNFNNIGKDEILGINWIASDGSYINIKSIALINFDNSIPNIQTKDLGKFSSIDGKTSANLIYSVNTVPNTSASQFTFDKALSGKTFTLESISDYLKNNLEQGFALHSITFEVMQGEIPAHDCPPSEVPVPAAAWLFGSALLGLAGFRKKAK